eukprot:TRINITY_DN6326_c0_g2_i3.p1 TRINITY_DN6326_c0_g2~~TRINITY_DN6326_c0_g2_i3.p1  ORF type:complete len:379 (-),score=57.94 TRINITY_DN6326_c0_g2_i3:138-1274(-)
MIEEGAIPESLLFDLEYCQAEALVASLLIKNRVNTSIPPDHLLDLHTVVSVQLLSVYVDIHNKVIVGDHNGFYVSPLHHVCFANHSVRSSVNTPDTFVYFDGLFAYFGDDCLAGLLIATFAANFPAATEFLKCNFEPGEDQDEPKFAAAKLFECEILGEPLYAVHSARDKRATLRPVTPILKHHWPHINDANVCQIRAHANLPAVKGVCVPSVLSRDITTIALPCWSGAVDAKEIDRVYKMLPAKNRPTAEQFVKIIGGEHIAGTVGGKVMARSEWMIAHTAPTTSGVSGSVIIDAREQLTQHEGVLYIRAVAMHVGSDFIIDLDSNQERLQEDGQVHNIALLFTHPIFRQLYLQQISMHIPKVLRSAAFFEHIGAEL